MDGVSLITPQGKCIFSKGCLTNVNEVSNLPVYLDFYSSYILVNCSRTILDTIDPNIDAKPGLTSIVWFVQRSPFIQNIVPQTQLIPHTKCVNAVVLHELRSALEQF